MNYLNYFEPYVSKNPWHEDQLTRAFLVTMRFVPLVQAAFLDLVREAQATAKSEHIVPAYCCSNGMRGRHAMDDSSWDEYPSPT
jgi:hypothetical protein